jgi:hypothetical protein
MVLFNQTLKADDKLDYLTVNSKKKAERKLLGWQVLQLHASNNQCLAEDEVMP